MAINHVLYVRVYDLLLKNGLVITNYVVENQFFFFENYILKP